MYVCGGGGVGGVGEGELTPSLHLTVFCKTVCTLTILVHNCGINLQSICTQIQDCNINENLPEKINDRFCIRR